MNANVHRAASGTCRLLARLCCLAMVSGLHVASADDITLHGFGTIGAPYIDKPADWGYRRSLHQRADLVF